MARRIRDAKLDTRTARLKLPQRREPYWRPLSAGLALGYRRGSTGGSWIARHYSREWGRCYLAIGPADDTLDAGALSFDAAQAKAREWLATVPAEQDAPAGPLTVARACDDYLAFLRHDGRSDAAIRDATYRIEAFIRPTLGAREVQSLKADELRRWRDRIASTAADSEPGTARSKNIGRTLVRASAVRVAPPSTGSGPHSGPRSITPSPRGGCSPMRHGARSSRSARWRPRASGI
jgi:hypothetical protein